MCRALLYLGQPVLLDNLLFQPDSALVRQSYMPKMLNMLNLAGFGLRAWGTAVTSFFRFLESSKARRAMRSQARTVIFGMNSPLPSCMLRSGQKPSVASRMITRSIVFPTPRRLRAGSTLA
jgi:hypothetical protein